MRKVFFSFHYGRDKWRVGVVRNSNVAGKAFENPYYDRAGWEAVKKKGDSAIKAWIDSQIKGTSVTAVLVGQETSTRKWVKYEIDETIRLGHGLIAIDISHIKNEKKEVDTTGPNPVPKYYSYYQWNNHNGRENLGDWIEKAAV